VREPSRVSVREREGEETTVLELAVAPGDRGRVIGQKGRTAGALRTLLSAAAARRGRRVELEIRE
jgi:predicted RNA-binding protein YlqC (UPF0109 family)